MTGKRFTIENDIEMKDNWNINKRCYHFGNGFDAKDCCNMLNELQDENKKLKSALKELKEIGDYQVMRIEELDNENQHFNLKFRDMLEFVREKGTVTKSDIDNWWNTNSME